MIGIPTQPPQRQAGQGVPAPAHGAAPLARGRLASRRWRA